MQSLLRRGVLFFVMFTAIVVCLQASPAGAEYVDYSITGHGSFAGAINSPIDPLTGAPIESNFSIHVFGNFTTVDFATFGGDPAVTDLQGTLTIDGLTYKFLDPLYVFNYQSGLLTGFGVWASAGAFYPPGYPPADMIEFSYNDADPFAEYAFGEGIASVSSPDVAFQDQNGLNLDIGALAFDNLSDVQINSVVTPEPSSLMLLGGGLTAGLFALRRKKSLAERTAGAISM